MKEVLITGASSGIGAAIAQLFSQQGWKTYLLGRNLGKLEQVQKKLTTPSEILCFDLSKTEDCKKLSSRLLELKTKISVLVNNAGIYKMGNFGHIPSTDWTQQFETNFFGAVRITEIVWSQILDQKGAIVNVSSTLGLRPIEGTGAYSASKAALNSWTQTLALEAGPQGVRVNAICPGLTDTPIHSFHKSEKPDHLMLRKKLDAMQPLQRMGTPEDIAQAVYFAASPQSQWMTGALIPVDGGILATTRDP